MTATKTGAALTALDPPDPRVPAADFPGLPDPLQAPAEAARAAIARTRRREQEAREAFAAIPAAERHDKLAAAGSPDAIPAPTLPAAQAEAESARAAAEAALHVEKQALRSWRSALAEHGALWATEQHERVERRRERIAEAVEQLAAEVDALEVERAPIRALAAFEQTRYFELDQTRSRAKQRARALDKLGTRGNRFAGSTVSAGDPHELLAAILVGTGAAGRPDYQRAAW